MFIPTVYISIGKTDAFFTLRETYEHTIYIRGEGDWGNAVINGVYQGSIIKEVRSSHIKNLSQNPDEAYAKAVDYSENNAIQLTTSRESLAEELRDIKRTNAEERERQEREWQARRDLWETERVAEQAEKFKLIEEGIFPVGKFAGKKFTDAPVSYINWLMNQEFDAPLMVALSSAVKVKCADMMLPVPNKDAVLGIIGERITCKAIVTRVASFRSDFGVCHIVTMITPENVCLVSKGSFHAEVGEKLEFKATVKKHDTYNGQAQTVINRVKELG